MKRLQQPRPPEITLQHESMLRALVERRRRLWKRLIEIGAYWEKVSGSRGLPQRARAIQAAPASGGQVAAGQKVQHRINQAGGGSGSSGSGTSEGRANAKTDGRSSTTTAVGNGGGVTASSPARSSLQKAAATAEAGRVIGGADVEMADATGRGGGQGATGSGQKAPQIGNNLRPPTPSTAAQARAGTTDVHAAAAACSSTAAVQRGAQPGVVVNGGVGAGDSSRAGVSSGRLDGAENPQRAPQGVALAGKGCMPAERLAGAGIVGRAVGGAAASASPSAEQAHETRPAKKLKVVSPSTERNAKESAVLMQERAKAQPAPRQINATVQTPPAAEKGKAAVAGAPQGATAKMSPPVQLQGKAAAETGSIPREGLEHMMCIYCGKETGKEVTEHLEECYRRVSTCALFQSP